MTDVRLTTAGGLTIGRASHAISSDLAVLINDMHGRGYDLWLRPAHTPGATVHIPADREITLVVVENLSVIDPPPWVDELRTYLAVTQPLPLGEPACPPST